MKQKFHLTRREFLRLSGLGLGAATLAACASPTPAPPATAPAGPRPIVGDVLEYALSGDWPGRFGSVTFRLHAGFFNGERAYFIRTDASEKEYSEAEGLVWAPLLSAGESAPAATSKLYLFEGAAAEQLPVLSAVPGMDAYSPLWQAHKVRGAGSERYDSEAKLMAAAASGAVTIEPENIFVNYPVVKWPGGEMTVDSEKAEYLGGGQLLAPVDTAGMRVTFKLHECFPGSRYIVTDTSAAPMAPMMAVSASAPTQGLIGSNFNGTAKIWVFANGLPGSGVMGFQPAIFDSQAGNPVWSPFWNHFTLGWKEGTTPRVLTSKEELAAALAAGEVEEFNGTPDTHPMGFVVNCPVPVLAPNTFAA